jgi:hypothetical protein
MLIIRRLEADFAAAEQHVLRGSLYSSQSYGVRDFALMRRALQLSAKHSQQAIRTMASEPLRIGLFGGGVVGGGVYTILEERKQQSFLVLGAQAQIVKVCVRDLAKPRSFTASAHTELVTDYDGTREQNYMLL